MKKTPKTNYQNIALIVIITLAFVGIIYSSGGMTGGAVTATKTWQASTAGWGPP